MDELKYEGFNLEELKFEELKLEERVHLAGELHLATFCHKLGFRDIDVEGIDLPIVDQ